MKIFGFFSDFFASKFLQMRFAENEVFYANRLKNFGKVTGKI
jgi:hypothetical protein